MAAGNRCEPVFHHAVDEISDAPDDETTLGADYQHHLYCRCYRQCGAGELCGLQGGDHRHDQVLCAGNCHARITANCVAPGFIETAMTAELPDAVKEKMVGNIPAGRMGTPEEIASAVAYLASNEASYVTGQTLHVNGGMAMI